MTITKVSYGKTYPLGNYSSERIDLEATIDETDRIPQVIDMLKSICDAEHKANNPHLYQEQTPIDYSNPPSTFTNNNGSDTLAMKYAPIEEQKLSPDQETEALLLAISEADATELPQYQLVAAKSQKTMGAYNKRKKQLNIQ